MVGMAINPQEYCKWAIDYHEKNIDLIGCSKDISIVEPTLRKYHENKGEFQKAANEFDKGNIGPLILGSINLQSDISTGARDSFYVAYNHFILA